MADSPLMKRLRNHAKSIGTRAWDELLNSEQRSDMVGSAVKKVQEGRRVLDESSARILAVLGLATQTDLERVSRKIGRLRKRMKAILERLDER